jgi:hypothetical protein
LYNFKNIITMDLFQYCDIINLVNFSKTISKISLIYLL